MYPISFQKVELKDAIGFAYGKGMCIDPKAEYEVASEDFTVVAEEFDIR